MRDLIFCLALDNDSGLGARTQARMLHDSARSWGWDKDFLVIHNKQEDFYGHRGTRHAKDLELKLPAKWEGRHESQNMKMHLDEWVDMEKYDRIMFCDIDTLFLADPNVLFDCSEADVSFAREDRSIKSHVFNTCFTEEQLQGFSPGTNGVNSGQFIVRNGVAQAVWEGWRWTLLNCWARNNKAQDQGPLNALLFFGNHNWTVEEFPKGFVRFPFTSEKVSAHWDAKFVHYCGWNGANKLRLGLQEFVGNSLIREKRHEETVLKVMEACR